MGLYGDEYFINEEINFNNLMNMLESTYTVDNSMIVSIDESLSDTVKKYVEKFIEFLRKCKEDIGKALEFIKRKIKEITSKIFNKANKKVMKEAFEYAYENCPKEKEIDELERKINNCCKIIDLDPATTKERAANFIASDDTLFLQPLTTMIYAARKYNKSYKELQAIIELMDYIGSIKDIKKYESVNINYDFIKNKSTL